MSPHFNDRVVLAACMKAAKFTKIALSADAGEPKYLAPMVDVYFEGLRHGIALIQGAPTREAILAGVRAVEEGENERAIAIAFTGDAHLTEVCLNGGHLTGDEYDAIHVLLVTRAGVVRDASIRYVAAPCGRVEYGELTHADERDLEGEVLDALREALA